MKERKQIDANGLRKFGLTTGLIVAGLFGLVIPLLRKAAVPLWPWVIAGALIAAALTMPARLGGFYRSWMRIGGVLGKVNTRIVLGALWCVVFVPTGYLMRLLGRDPLARRLDPGAASYRTASPPMDRRNMEEPF